MSCGVVTPLLRRLAPLILLSCCRREPCLSVCLSGGTFARGILVSKDNRIALMYVRCDALQPDQGSCGGYFFGGLLFAIQQGLCYVVRGSTHFTLHAMPFHLYPSQEPTFTCSHGALPCSQEPVTTCPGMWHRVANNHELAWPSFDQTPNTRPRLWNLIRDLVSSLAMGRC